MQFLLPHSVVLTLLSAVYSFSFRSSLFYSSCTSLVISSNKAFTQPKALTRPNPSRGDTRLLTAPVSLNFITSSILMLFVNYLFENSYLLISVHIWATSQSLCCAFILLIFISERERMFMFAIVVRPSVV